MTAKKKRLVVIAAFGDRKAQVTRLVHNIRRYVDYPIHIITTEDSSIGPTYHFGGIYREYVKRVWPADEPRSGVRNSNYYKINKVLRCYFEKDNDYNSVLLLDDDMYIVNENFVDGFDIAEKFGAALPLNPRTYVWVNALGADVQRKDRNDLIGAPHHAPTCNFSPFFISPKHIQARNFAAVLEAELRDNVCRGTLAVWKASWKTGFSPVYLPQQWCVCGAEAQYIKDYTQQLRGQRLKIPSMMLHLGHQQAADVFKDEIECMS